MQSKCKYFSHVSDLANTGAGIQRKRTLAKSLRDSFRRLKSRRGSRKKRADGSAASPGSARSPERYVFSEPKSYLNLTENTSEHFSPSDFVLVFIVLMSKGIFGGKNVPCLLQSLNEILYKIFPQS